MPGLVRKSLDSPEETRPVEAGTGQFHWQGFADYPKR